MTQSMIAGIIFIIIGMVLAVAPLQVWEIAEKWKSEKAELPSRQYLIVERILSGVFLGFGVLLALGVLS